MTSDSHDQPDIATPARRDPGPAGPGVGADARRRIGRNLRLLYGGVLDQPLPERFTRLIDELAADPSTRKGS